MAEEQGEKLITLDETLKPVYTLRIVGHKEGAVEIESTPELSQAAVLGILVILVRRLGG